MFLFGLFEGSGNYRVEKLPVALISTLIIVIGVVLILHFKDRIRGNEKVYKIFRITLTIIGISYLIYDPIRTTYLNSRFPYDKLPLHLCSLTTVSYLLFLNFKQFDFLQKWTFNFSIFGVLLALFLSTAKMDVDCYAFWNYYIGHITIVIAYVFYMVYNSSSSSWRDFMYGNALLAAVSLVIIVPINLVLDTDYMFLGPNVDQIQVFGDWPLGLILIMIVGFILFSLLALIHIGIAKLIANKSK